jgi:hypothetical protein
LSFTIIALSKKGVIRNERGKEGKLEKTWTWLVNAVVILGLIMGSLGYTKTASGLEKVKLLDAKFYQFTKNLRII